MKRLIFALLLVATAAKAGEDCTHDWKTKSKTTKCCLSGQSEPNCTGTQTATYLYCTKCSAERGHDSGTCQ